MIVYRAAHVVPVAAPPIAGGAVAVEGERIVYVGPSAGAPSGERRDLGDALLLPGLVNAHTHLELTAMRGFLEDLPFRDWILGLVGAKRAVLDRAMMLDAARLGIAEGLRAGITTYADTCDSGVALQAMREAGVRGVMYQEAFGPAPEMRDDSMRELRAKVDAHRSLETPLVRVGVSPHAPYTVSDALFSAVAGYAVEEGLPVAIHIAESAVESALVVDGAGAFADGLRARGIAVATRGRSPIDLLRRTGALAARPLLIHVVRADAEDVATIADAGCAVAHCPLSNAKLGHGVAPLLELLAAGVPVGLGSDSMASNNRMHILEEARAAVLAQRVRAGRPDVLPAPRTLELATLGGARALGLDARVGSLEVGKDADLAAFPLGDAAGAGVPVYDPAMAAVFALGGATASFVAVAGRVLVEDGRLLHEDAAVAGRVAATAAALAAWRRAG